jgi:DNA polymerase-1
MAALDDLKLTLVRSWDDAQDFRAWLGENRRILAVDVETTGLNVGCDYIRLCQFGDSKRGWAFDYKDWRGLIKESIEGYNKPIVAHNLLYDSKMLKADGIIIPQLHAHDSMIMTHLTNPAARMGLKAAATQYVDPRASAGQKLLAEAMANGGWTWATVPVELPAYWIYSTLDTCLSAMLAEKLWRNIAYEYRAAYELELGTIHCLREAELAGLLVDEEYRLRAAAQLSAEIAWLAPQIPVTNPNSDVQIVRYLQDIGVRLFVRTEHGALSVDKEVLRWFAPEFPICSTIEQYRSKSRHLGNYIEKFAEIGTEKGLAVRGVLRASTKPVGARTGRQSVTDPPLQTLPRGRLVRDAIIARPGSCFVMSDFAGMEMRALASFAQEKNMLAAFARGEDLHDFVAKALYGENFTKQERTLCKNGGFSKVYGAGLEKFAVTAQVDVGSAKEFLDSYNTMFPGVNEFLANVAAEVKRRADGGPYGWVQLIDGRRLPVESDKAYKGVNFTIQGSCAVVTKEKICELDAAGLGEYFRLSVHDELLYEVPIEDAADVRQVIREVMPDRRNFPDVVLEVDTDIVNRWGQHYRGDFEAYLPTEDPEWLEEAA